MTVKSTVSQRNAVGCRLVRLSPTSHVHFPSQTPHSMVYCFKKTLQHILKTCCKS